MTRTILVAFLVLCLLAAPALAADVDKVLVEKKKRRMVLLSGGQVVKEYRISLGGHPQGHKQKQGDERTPEGRYIIDYRNPQGSYHLSLHISYPDAEDKKRAREKGVDPGGLIFIHGLPDSYVGPQGIAKRFDWTDGCIAVNNDEIEEIWNLVKNGTPIEIRP